MPAATKDLPPPSAELVLFRVAIQAHLRTAHLKPKLRAEAFLDEMGSLLASEEAVLALFPSRPRNEREAQASARLGAAAWFDAVHPAFAAAIPRFI
jgi:hypothetical protein